jgi:membrane protease YdiL (CAAX protease family)
MKATEGRQAEKTAQIANSTCPAWPLVVGLFLPTLVTWIYFDLLADQPSYFQQLASGLGKGLQILLPLLALWLGMKTAKFDAPKYAPSALAGLGFGLAVAALMIATYFFLMLPSGAMDGPRLAAKKKIVEFGVGSPAAMIGLGIFYSLCHSAFEEYYWRWFIYRGLQARMGLASAAVISGIGFMAHHILVLALYFGWDSPLTWLFSLGIAVGGATWAVIYRRWGTILGPWLSHLIVDAAIFGIGYHLLFLYQP